MPIAALALTVLLVAALPQAAAAQAIDCGKHIQAADAAIDKVTEDMKGMEHMPKDQLTEINRLIDEAKKSLAGARRDCAPSRTDYDRARGIAQAGAARGSAEAADILHWHLMRSAAGMKPGGGMSGMPSGSGTAAGSSMPGMKH
jgi:hypothetical protein